MTQKWFVSQGDRVYGPWSTEDVSVHRQNGNVNDGDLIWGSGNDTWVALAKWSPSTRVNVAAPEAVARETNDAEATVITAVTLASLDEATAGPAVTSPAVADETWHYAVDGASYGPFSRPGLTSELRRLPSLAGVTLWTKGMRDWAGVFEFHEIAGELGVNQREFPRAAIVGRAVLKVDGLSQVAPIASISEGGLGLKLDSDFFTGQTVEVEVQAEALGGAFGVTAEIRYCARGIVGLRFQSPTSAVRGRIAGYVKHAGTAKAA